MTMSHVDFYVYGAVVAMTNNSGKAVIFPMASLCELFGLRAIQIMSSLSKIQKNELLRVIYVDDRVCIQASPTLPEMIHDAIPTQIYSSGGA